MTILIVDDDMVVRELMRQFFEQLPEDTAIIVDSGREALRCLERKRIDVVLTDLCMPDISGWDVLSGALRQWVQSPYVIAMTAYLNEEVRERARNAGIYAMLEKPFDLEELKHILNKLRRWVDVRRS